MVVDRDREHLLGVILADDVVVEDLSDLLRGQDAVARLHQRGLVPLADDVHAQLDALVANEDARAGNELADFVLALAAERAIERILRVASADLAHSRSPSTTNGLAPLMHPAKKVQHRPWHSRRGPAAPAHEDSGTG